MKLRRDNPLLLAAIGFAATAAALGCTRPHDNAGAPRLVAFARR